MNRDRGGGVSVLFWGITRQRKQEILGIMLSDGTERLMIFGGSGKGRGWMELVPVEIRFIGRLGSDVHDAGQGLRCVKASRLWDMRVT